jgi:hypothetical protein
LHCFRSGDERLGPTLRPTDWTVEFGEALATIVDGALVNDQGCQAIAILLARVLLALVEEQQRRISLHTGFEQGRQRRPIGNEGIANNILYFHEEGEADAVEFSTIYQASADGDQYIPEYWT